MNLGVRTILPAMKEYIGEGAYVHTDRKRKSLNLSHLLWSVE
jgi:hypothetical protein